MFNRLTSVIFDFDGVIVESMQNNFSAWQKTFQEFSIPFIDAEYYALEGIKPISVVEYFLKKSAKTPEQAFCQKLIQIKEKHYLSGPPSPLYPNILEILQLLKQKNIKIGLVSGGARKRILSALQDYQILNYFDVIVSADDVLKGKPDPEPFQKALASLQCPLAQTVVIENAPLGIRSAKLAGLKVIAIGTTLGEKDLIEADSYLKNHDDLYRFFVDIVE